jgi:hypothetical protein
MAGDVTNIGDKNLFQEVIESDMPVLVDTQAL